MYAGSPWEDEQRRGQRDMADSSCSSDVEPVKLEVLSRGIVMGVGGGGVGGSDSRVEAADTGGASALSLKIQR